MQVSGCGPFVRWGVRRWRNAKSGAASPTVGRDGPARWRQFDCQVSGGPRSRPGCRRAAPWAASFGWLPPVGRLEPPARDCREWAMMLVVVDRLLDVVAVVMVDADATPAADSVAAVSNGAGNRQDGPSFDPGSCHPLRRQHRLRHPARDELRQPACHRNAERGVKPDVRRNSARGNWASAAGMVVAWSATGPGNTAWRQWTLGLSLMTVRSVWS